ncbi:MAG: MogA/MoaB family molybdenum cofactor biosynthesis protein [Chloroflexi bacterium]|nr:MogA/MoaB family molybdenum cofactor biosynthesis protein [Chloroflexota bacterium]
MPARQHASTEVVVPDISPQGTPGHTAAVLTVSDLGAAGQRVDTAGPATAEVLGAAGFEVVDSAIVPDDQERIIERLEAWAAADIALVVTAGGTGLTPRDRTPEATARVVEYQVPGIPEAMRRAFVDHLPTVMLSRGIAGVRGRTLIVNLPGSEKAVRENLAVVLPALAHACDQIRGETAEVAETHEAIQSADTDQPPDAD